MSRRSSVLGQGLGFPAGECMQTWYRLLRRYLAVCASGRLPDRDRALPPRPPRHPASVLGRSVGSAMTPVMAVVRARTAHQAFGSSTQRPPMPKPSAISVPRLPVPPSPRPTALLPFTGLSAPLPKSAEPLSNPFRVTPVVAHTVAGCRPRAPLDDAGAAKVMASFERDILARSTALTRASNVRTWIFFHVRWFGEGTPVLPLTPGIIFAIAAQFKAQGYRSFPNYVSAMKDVHSDEYPWSAELARALKRAVHSTQ